MGIYELVTGKPEPPLTEGQLVEQRKAVKHWNYRIATHGIFYSLDLFLGYPMAVIFDKEYSLKEVDTKIFNDINKRRETNEYKRNSTRRKTAKKMD